MPRAWLPTLLIATSCGGEPPPRAVLPPREPAPPGAIAAATSRPAPPTSPTLSAPALTQSLGDATARPELAEPNPSSPSAPSPEPAVTRPTPTLRIEPVYSALGHARLATEMLTLERDEELFHWSLGGSSSPEHPGNRPGYHPATRVVVDVELLSRAPKGTTARLRRIARASGYWPLRACFETAQRGAVKLERAARVRLTVSGAGRVLGARSIGPAPDREYARCALSRLRELDFRPGFSRKLDVEISVKQWPGHAPTPPRTPDGLPVVTLSRAGAEALAALEPALLNCYQEGLDTDPRLWGRLALRLRLSSEGAVEDATQVETRFPSDAVTACVASSLRGTRLQASTRELTFAVRFGQPVVQSTAVPVEPQGTVGPGAAPSALPGGE